MSHLSTFNERLADEMIKNHFVVGNTKKRPDVSALSKALDCSADMARRYLRGENIPSLDSIDKLASWLGISPAWLLYGIHPANEIAEYSISTLVDIIVQMKPLLTKPNISSSEYIRRAGEIAEIYKCILDLDNDSIKESTVKMMVKSLIALASKGKTSLEK